MKEKLLHLHFLEAKPGIHEGINHLKPDGTGTWRPHILHFLQKFQRRRIEKSFQSFIDNENWIISANSNFSASKLESIYKISGGVLYPSVDLSEFPKDGGIGEEEVFKKIEIPHEWIKKLAEKTLSKEEMEKISSLGSFEKLMETLKKRLAEQKDRHQGGNKWVGTAGTSPFGAYGYNPEGIRIGQHESRHKRAVKVWDKRDFKNFDSDIELGTRGMKVALKRLRKWARDGADEELDLENTISSSAKSGFIDVRTRPERRNSIKVIIFFDVGGSMDAYIRQVEELFSAARTAFKHLEYYYFHNCLYEGVWKNNHRRWTEQTPTTEVMNTYGKDYRCIFVGDASMSPYEIEYPGGANEHYNAESGRTWLERAITKWPNYLWINPTTKDHW